MNTEGNHAYSAPVLVTLGSAEELTQNVNTPGPGDTQFSVLAPFPS